MRNTKTGNDHCLPSQLRSGLCRLTSGGSNDSKEKQQQSLAKGKESMVAIIAPGIQGRIWLCLFWCKKIRSMHMQDSQKVHGKCMIWKILGMDFKVFIHQIKLVFWSVPIKSQDKNFCLRIPFFTLISWVWLSIGTLALRYMCETRKPPFAYYSPGGHPAAKCQLNRGESRGLQSKGSRMANCHQFLQQVWHLGILLLSPLPQVNAENLGLERCLSYQLQLLPSFPVRF